MLSSRTESHRAPLSASDRPIGVGRPGPGTPGADVEMQWLSQLWGEVGFLLRQPSRITDEDSARAVEKDANSGLMFLDRLAAAASRLGCLQGTLSRIILPFDVYVNRAAAHAYSFD
jgi:hypothetical protein